MIKKVLDEGVCSRGTLAALFLLKNNIEPPANRAAFIVKKNLFNKKLVLRNRFRRLLRESYRKIKHLLPSGYDIVILATRIKKDIPLAEIEKDLSNVFKEGLKKSN